MHQHPGDGDSQRHISFEFHRRGGGHHQRQEENAPSPISASRVSVGEPFGNAPLISRIIASSLTIDPPIIAGISGDMVPISASSDPGADAFQG